MADLHLRGELALRLQGRCPHCGGTILVAFRKEMFRSMRAAGLQEGPLLAAVWHQGDPTAPDWQRVTGLDAVRAFIPLTEEQPGSDWTDPKG